MECIESALECSGICFRLGGRLICLVAYIRAHPSPVAGRMLGDTAAHRSSPFDPRLTSIEARGTVSWGATPLEFLSDLGRGVADFQAKAPLPAGYVDCHGVLHGSHNVKLQLLPSPKRLWIH